MLRIGPGVSEITRMSSSPSNTFHACASVVVEEAAPSVVAGCFVQEEEKAATATATATAPARATLETSVFAVGHRMCGAVIARAAGFTRFSVQKPSNRRSRVGAHQRGPERERRRAAPRGQGVHLRPRRGWRAHLLACKDFSEYLGRIGLPDNISCWLEPVRNDKRVQLCEYCKQWATRDANDSVPPLERAPGQ